MESPRHRIHAQSRRTLAEDQRKTVQHPLAIMQREDRFLVYRDVSEAWVHPVRLEREHLSLSVAAMPDVSEGDLLGMLAFLSFGNRYSRAIVMWKDGATATATAQSRCGPRRAPQ